MIGDVIKSDLFHFLKRGAKCAITVGLKINHASKRKQAFIPVVLIFITPIHIRSCKAIDYYRNVGCTSLCSIGIMKQQV